MKRLKSVAKVFLLTMCLIGMFSMNVQASETVAEVTASGDWYDLTWELVDGVLTISGEGNMMSGFYYSEYPWYEYRSQVNSIVVEEGVTQIGIYAFGLCGAKSVTLPESMEVIQMGAFLKCYNLDEVNLPDSIKTVGSRAFEGCFKLSDSTLQNILSKVTVVYEYAFADCDSLTSVTIPANITYIGEGIFSSCDRLTGISVDTANKNYCAENNMLFNKSKEILLAVAGDFVPLIPNGVTRIGAGTFASCDLDVVLMPNSLIEIGGSAFVGCDELFGVTMPEGVTTIENYAFFNCSRLTTITIPTSVTTIGDYAFSGTGITDVTIPKEVTSIGMNAFGYDASSKIEDYIIRGYTGSAAEEYATNNDITFISLGYAEDTDDNMDVYVSITSYGSEADEISLNLYSDGPTWTAKVTGNSATYMFKDIQLQSYYVLGVGKKNHVPWACGIEIGEQRVEIDVELFLWGDVTGDGTVNAKDKKVIFNHIGGTVTLTDYIFNVGDVTEDGYINAKDKKLIYNHIAGTSSLWE